MYDDLSDWLGERCEHGDDWREPTAALYADYCAWTTTTPPTVRAFGYRLSRLGFGRATNGRQRLRTGLRLRHDDGTATTGDAYDLRIPNVPIWDADGRFVPPRDLSPAMRQWLTGLYDDYETPESLLRLGILAAETYDLAEAAAAVLRRESLVIRNRQGNLVPHPAVSVLNAMAAQYRALSRHFAEAPPIDDDA